MVHVQPALSIQPALDLWEYSALWTWRVRISSWSCFQFVYYSGFYLYHNKSLYLLLWSSFFWSWHPFMFIRFPFLTLPYRPTFPGHWWSYGIIGLIFTSQGHSRRSSDSMGRRMQSSLGQGQLWKLLLPFCRPGRGGSQHSSPPPTHQSGHMLCWGAPALCPPSSPSVHISLPPCPLFLPFISSFLTLILILSIWKGSFWTLCVNTRT